MKTLNLTLKAHWYDIIESGKKPEEYREVKEYWIKRLMNGFYHNAKSAASDPLQSFKAFDLVNFARGGHFHPSLPQMSFECKGISIGKGNPDWGAPLEDVFIIKLGERIK